MPAPARGRAAVRISKATKRFKIYHQPRLGMLKELLFPWRRQKYYREFLAVKDASLEIRRGEVVGLVGANGAGKSTLLKMVAGLLPVDEGHIEINGKVTAVMAMGVGAHPEFSGRENILYGGMLLGMSKREVLAKTPAIIRFAELSEFIDQPLKTYSAGMTARLLFAIAMSVDPDILIVDEALATGDQRFVDKCLSRIREFAEQGVTIFFVSHNLGLVEQLCDRAVYMRDGSIICQGAPAETIRRYQAESQPARSSSHDSPTPVNTAPITIEQTRIVDDEGREQNEWDSGRSVVVELDYRRETAGSRQLQTSLVLCRHNDRTPVLRIGGRNSRIAAPDRHGTLRFPIPPVYLSAGQFQLAIELKPAGQDAIYRDLLRSVDISNSRDGSNASSDPHCKITHGDAAVSTVQKTPLSANSVDVIARQFAYNEKLV